MTPAEVLAAAKANIEAAVEKEVDGILKLVRECLEKNPHEKFVRIMYSYKLDDICAYGAEYRLQQLGYRARWVRRWLRADYMEVAGWHDAKSPTPDRGPYRKVARVEQANEDDFGF